jgi:hypothetical protein
MLRWIQNGHERDVRYNVAKIKSTKPVVIETIDFAPPLPTLPHKQD